MYYIKAISTISFQNSFECDNLYDSLKVIDSESELFKPNYKEFISPVALRRLSPILRMGLTNSLDCQKQLEEEIDAVIVGTGLGCLKDTEKFLINFNTAVSDLLSPTSFIQSTHNTIGGQISLAMKNHGYNMTHTQNNVSFELSLLDGIMCLNEGKSNVLIGAADEFIPFLNKLQPELLSDKYPLTSSSAFFVFSQEAVDTRIGIKNVHISFDPEKIDKEIEEFLKQNNLTLSDIDLIEHSDVNSNTIQEHPKTLNYLQYTGMNFSASAVATHIAHDYLKGNDKRNVLIVNALLKSSLGLILVSKSEA
tara:strand:+ start:39 stop:962 length:924 start_codon:yes stop_codon:yes gene_type:complete